MNDTSTTARRPATLARRLASMLYECLLLGALVFFASFPLIPFYQVAGAAAPLVQRIYVLLVVGAYFVWFWLHGGQTLPMKTWRLRLVAAGSETLSPMRALTRYLLAIPSVCFGVGLLWALFDRERQFLHDRLAGTRLIDVSAEKTTEA